MRAAQGGTPCGAGGGAAAVGLCECAARIAVTGRGVSSSVPERVQACPVRAGPGSAGPAPGRVRHTV